MKCALNTQYVKKDYVITPDFGCRKGIQKVLLVCLYVCHVISEHFHPITHLILPLKSFSAQKKTLFLFHPHQFPINILCCSMVKPLVIFCVLCSEQYGAEGTAPDKLRSPRWRIRANSELFSATSLACTHTGICSIMNPNMTALIWKVNCSHWAARD